jgi:hypothetical protein
LRELSDHKGVLLEEPEYFGPHTLCRAARRRFPGLGEALTESRDSVHGQVAILAREVQAGIAANAAIRALQPFSFLEDVLHEARLHSEVENAVAISFVIPAELRSSNLGARVLAEAERTAPRVLSLLLAEERADHV